MVGVIGFTVLLGFTLGLPRRWAFRGLLAAATIATVSGAGLFALQAFVLNRFCPWCVVVDVLAVAIAVPTWLLARSLKTAKTVTLLLRPPVVACFAFAAGMVPVLWPHFRPATPVPAVLATLQDPERTTLVEFVDLQCPHCRALYPTLEQLRREYGDKIRIRRFHVPHSTHPISYQAARLIECASTAEQAYELERALFETSLFTERSVREAAHRVSITDAQMKRCWSDPASARAVQAHIELYRRVGRFGLPTTFVAGERITGAASAAFYRAAIARARRSPASARGQAAAFWGIVVLWLLSSYFVGNGVVGRGSPEER
jgi:predicted DsbA family dithiol-disulfide isomerase